jgi:endonuclease/exonuclease/phosphatase family metal-dependent hydrolase
LILNFKRSFRLTFTQKVFYPTNLSLATLPWFTRLKEIGKKFLRFPGLNRLKPRIVQALSVTRPPTLFTGQHYPKNVREQQKEDITILSANLWHDWPHHRRLIDRLKSFVQMVEQKGADIVLLQEVARTPLLKTDEWLAQRLGMAYFYIRANGNEETIGFEEGLAILSRFPLTDPQVKQLGEVTSPFTRRMALSAQVETPFGGLRAFCAHLGLVPGHNVNQVDHLHDWVSMTTQKGSALIGGDFNAHETSSQIIKTKRSWLDTFRSLHPTKDGTTHELKTPWGRILRRSRRDYLFLQPGHRCWKVLEASHLEPPDIFLSDHQVVMARLKPVECGG